MLAAKVVFRCSLCGEVAGIVEAVPAEKPLTNWEGQTIAGWVARSGFLGENREGLGPEAFEAAAGAVAQESPRALHELDPLWAPFFCPRCDRSYCRAHWIVLDVNDEELPHWHDYTAGISQWTSADGG